MEDLKRLPFRVIEAKVIGEPGRLVEVLVDGDYDGEWFAGIPWRVHYNGFVMIGNSPDSILGQQFGTGLRYLHHFVLPKKEGYQRYHLNGNKLDNRSCNIGYITHSERMTDAYRKVKLRDFEMTKYRLRNPRRE